MEIIKINKIELEVPSNWNEVSISNYYKLRDLSTDYLNNEANWIPEKYILDYASILIGCEPSVLYNLELTNEDWLNINKIITNFQTQPIAEKFDVIKIDDRLYSYNNLNKMTAGEYVSVKLTLKKLPLEKQLSYLMAILVRPCKKVWNEEFNYDQYIVDDFNEYNSDNEIIEKRMDMYMNIPYTYALYIEELFLNGKIR